MIYATHRCVPLRNCAFYAEICTSAKGDQMPGARLRESPAWGKAERHKEALSLEASE